MRAPFCTSGSICCSRARGDKNSSLRSPTPPGTSPVGGKPTLGGNIRIEPLHRKPSIEMSENGEPAPYQEEREFLAPRAREEQCLPADPARSALARSLRTSDL